MKPTTKRGAGISSFLLLFLLPGIAFAQVRITEVMYDAPGADSGREWVEVTNIGGENVDIGKYKLFENGTNHGLALVSGNSSLAAGASAILADDPAKFLADYPSYAGALFNTAFSLSNTGETLVLKDASSTILDSVSYVAAADADGTGGSLHKSDAAFVAAMANPGAYPGTLISVPKKEQPTKTASAPKKSSTTSASTKKTGSSSAAASAAPKFDSNSASPASSADFVSSIPPYVLWLLGLAGIILVGIAGVFSLQFSKKETYLTADEFKIE